MYRSSHSIKACPCRSQRTPFMGYTCHKAAISATVTAALESESAAPEQSGRDRLLHVLSEAPLAVIQYTGCQDHSSGGLCAVFVSCLLREFGDSITKSDVVRQQKLVVLQLGHIMRV